MASFKKKEKEILNERDLDEQIELESNDSIRQS